MKDILSIATNGGCGIVAEDIGVLSFPLFQRRETPHAKYLWRTSQKPMVRFLPKDLLKDGAFRLPKGPGTIWVDAKSCD